MTSSAPPLPRDRGFWPLVYPKFIPFVLGLTIAGACYASCGASLGLFFGPMLLLTFLAPGMAMGEDRAAARLLGCAALIGGIGLVWLVAGNLTAYTAARCVVVLASYILALAGAASALECVGLGKVFAASATAVIGAAWLTWPVWLSPWLNGPHAQSAIEWLTSAHPLMALNGILFSRFNFWDRYTISYQQLTILNQDVLYTLPGTIGWMAAAHLAVGFGGFAAKIAGEVKQKRSVAADGGRFHPPASKPG